MQILSNLKFNPSRGAYANLDAAELFISPQIFRLVTSEKVLKTKGFRWL